MRFAVFFAALAAVFAVLAVQLGPLTLPGAAGLLTALGLVGPTVAYALGRPALLGKSRDGVHPGWAQFLHGSYFGLCRASATLARLRGQDAWNTVTDGVLLGARPLPKEVPRLLEQERVGAVLDLTCELVDSAALRKKTTYLCLPVLDGTPPSEEQLTEGVAFIEHHRSQHPVYVHCAVGRGRSATMVAAWALHAGLADSVDSAEAWMQENRPGARLHPTQKAAVQQWWASKAA
jgi:diacylglycerol kinase (ATP)